MTGYEHGEGWKKAEELQGHRSAPTSGYTWVGKEDSTLINPVVSSFFIS